MNVCPSLHFAVKGESSLYFAGTTKVPAMIGREGGMETKSRTELKDATYQ
jgi:hypothetical protein